jgi:hypothetical protein
MARKGPIWVVVFVVPHCGVIWVCSAAKMVASRCGMDRCECSVATKLELFWTVELGF